MKDGRDIDRRPARSRRPGETRRRHHGSRRRRGRGRPRFRRPMPPAPAWIRSGRRPPRCPSSRRCADASPSASRSRLASIATTCGTSCAPTRRDRIGRCASFGPVSAGSPSDQAAPSDDIAHPQFDRRGFLSRFNDTLSQAAIQEKPAALALIYLDGLAEIARVVDAKISEQVLSAAILRLPEETRSHTRRRLRAGLVSRSAERRASGDRDRELRPRHDRTLRLESLREPARAVRRSEMRRSIDTVCGRLHPRAGRLLAAQPARQGTLGGSRGAARELGPDPLLHGHAEASLPRPARCGARDPRGDREPRDPAALHRGATISPPDGWSRRWGTCDGIIRCAASSRRPNFSAMAETTGLATLLSRSLLDGLREDFAALAPELPPDARLSFGPAAASSAAGRFRR